MGHDNDNDITARIAKLPRWARQHIDKLTADLESANRKLRASTDPGSRVRWGHLGIDNDRGTPIPEGEPIIFSMVPFSECKHRVRIKAAYDPDTGTLEISGGDAVDVEPVARNVIRVRCGKLFD